MVALVYHPAYDPYGCVIRSVQFLIATDNPMFAEQLRLFDFMLLFPEFISKFRLNTTLRSRFSRIKYRKKFGYEERPPASRLFSEMELSFEAAIQTLKSINILKSEQLNIDLFSINIDAVPDTLISIAKKRTDSDSELLDFLVELNSSFPFFGPDGLKDRSGLLEFRYDII